MCNISIKVIKVQLIILFFLTFFVLSNVFADTYYVDDSMSDDSGDGTTWGTAKKYINSGISLMSGGDTLIIKDGTYTGAVNRIVNPPSGSPGAYTTIRAENDWGVTLSAVYTSWPFPCHIYVGYSYIKIQGIKIVNSTPSHFYILGDHIKVIRCASDGVGSGASFSFRGGGQYILFEECYSYGAGRYPFETGDPAQYVIFRRCVNRWDYSNTVEPIASFAAYDTAYSGASHIYFQNCIAIDGKDIKGQDPTYDGLKGFFTPNGANAVEFQGCISLNMEGAGFWIEDSPVQDITITDCIAWNSKDAGQSASEAYDAYLLYVRADDDGGPLTIDHSTFGISDLGRGLQINQPLPNDTVRNSIIYGITLDASEYALNGATEDYNSYYNNTGDRNRSGGVGTNSIENINPLTNSLLYLTRIENSSDLDGQADDGGDIGTTILKQVGVSGALYGETGWNTITDEDLWPFPNEDEMRTDMKAFSMAAGEAYTGSPAMSGDRGFCVDGQTLTTYIWEYLGNEIPSEIYTFIAPSDLVATAGSSSSITLGWTDNSDNEGGFKIERKKAGVGSYAQIATVGAGIIAYEDTGLSSSTTYWYRVRAYAGSTNSDYSNETSATTSAAASGGGGGGGGGGCFIATAAYGSPDAVEKQILCKFRDEYLLNNGLGKKFVGFYYKVSPPIADYIAERQWAKKVVRGVLRPMVWLVKKFIIV